ncbi:hypothetical protein PF010_g425 [Phytophthora fragariae]|uniref:Uncharacterized protein n=1 Tax=Phytophthora fragariae TaxID=53985 RepID=A0A6A3MPB6_9STRA|nr:hypothetical protein PF003_g5713 [Phytophthora fragariae]KAE9031105.1 hypothetical protein PF011_g302 [Phytophthora fragariae]KAE9139853.1 hypothetical protein PF010_g425 [Phytophthora fragariae]KAE9141574.1 hypothetical protein PF007_g100 [Phytophthora fragariae]KAE9255888.1 hypothetical protein PF004_g387 [Phytophthora fragariae]
MKDEMLRALQRVADMLVGNFTVSFQNELRFMVRIAWGVRWSLLRTLKLMPLLCVLRVG